MANIHFHIISPSGAIAPELIDGAMKRLTDWGYTATEGCYARSQSGRFAGTDEERFSDLIEAFKNPSTRYILCSRGGYGLQRIAAEIAQAPLQGCFSKTIIGFSDVTVLHQALAVRGIATLHGFMCKGLSELNEDSPALRAWHDAVEGKALHYEMSGEQISPLNHYGAIQGRVFGGNLSVLYGLQGTRLSLEEVMRQQCSEEERPILFIEDIGERHYHIERMLLNLKMSGVFAKIGGLIVGQFTDCEVDKGMGETVYETIARVTKPYSIPKLFNFPAGHIAENMPLWFGKEAVLEINKDNASLSY